MLPQSQLAQQKLEEELERAERRWAALGVALAPPGLIGLIASATRVTG